MTMNLLTVKLLPKTNEELMLVKSQKNPPKNKKGTKIPPKTRLRPNMPELKSQSLRVNAGSATACTIRVTHKKHLSAATSWTQKQEGGLNTPLGRLSKAAANLYLGRWWNSDGGAFTVCHAPLLVTMAIFWHPFALVYWFVIKAQVGPCSQTCEESPAKI